MAGTTDCRVWSSPLDGDASQTPSCVYRIRAISVFLIGACLLVSNSGCTGLVGVRDYIAYNDMSNDFVVGYRNHVWAKQSWHENKRCFANEPHLKAFGDGYRTGYRDVASGGGGCQPSLPPRSYWTWKHQTPEGQAQMAAWLTGFPHGAAAAKRDMAGEWMDIPVSHHVKLQYSPDFQDGTLYLPEQLRRELQMGSPDHLVPGETPPPRALPPTRPPDATRLPEPGPPRQPRNPR